MKVTEFFMRRSTLFWSLMAAILIAGVIAFIQMPKLEDPAVAVKQAMVVVPYPGASAHEVELDVAIKMEDALRTLPDVKKIKTECHDGTAGNAENPIPASQRTYEVDHNQGYRENVGADQQ